MSQSPSTSTSNPSTPIGWTVAFAAFPLASMTHQLITLQSLQAAAMLEWQKEWMVVTRDLQDQWVSHWAGGVPIGA